MQAWSPFQYGMFEGIFIGNEKFPELNKVLDRLAEKYGVTQNAIAVAWIMRHPAGIQTIVGSTNLKRIQDISRASDIVLSREEWYEIYLAAGKIAAVRKSISSESDGKELCLTVRRRERAFMEKKCV